MKRVLGDVVDHVTEEKTFYKLGQFVSRRLAKTIRKRRIGFPNLDKGSTSVVERTNLNLRHFTRRFTRCTLGFSKKLINHRLAVDLFVWHSNFARKHITLKTTPALALGLNVAMMQTAGHVITPTVRQGVDDEFGLLADGQEGELRPRPGFLYR